MLTVTPFLWFESQAEDAANFYASIFPRAKVLSVTRMQGKVMTAELEIEGQRVVALNGNTQFKFNDSFSFQVGCEAQDDIDRLWAQLTADGGEPGRCGWLKDRFGVSWQIIPISLPRWLSGGGDPARAQRVMGVFFQMSKIDVGQLQRAFDG